MNTAALVIPCFLRPKTAERTVPPLMRRAIGALRYDYEVRLFSKGELCILYAGFFSRDQVHTITEYKSYLHIRAAQCSVVWLLKQKEKQNAQN